MIINKLGILSSNKNSLDFIINNNLNKELILHSIASRNIEDAKILADQFNFFKFYGSYEELINDEDVDIVINFLPNSIKFEYTYLLLKSNKKVITNYPLFDSVNDLNFVNEISNSSLKSNLFLIYENNFFNLKNTNNNITYIKFPPINFASSLSNMVDYLSQQSPDLFYLLYTLKNEKLKFTILKKEYDPLYGSLSYINAHILVNDSININVIIDNINTSESNSIIINDSLSTFDKKYFLNKSTKVFNYNDLMKFIKNNKTFDNCPFFQYYPYKLFYEVIINE